MNPKFIIRNNRPCLGGACLAPLLVALCGQALHAADWDGSENTDWSEPLNWSGDAVPDDTGWASIWTGPANFPVISANVAGSPRAVNIGSWDTSRLDHTAGSFALAAGGSWEGGALLVGGGGNTGIYNIADTAGTGGAFTGYGTGTGSFTTGASGGINLGNGFWWDHSTAVVNINTSGTVHSSGNLIIAQKTGDTGTLNIDAGAVTVAGGWQDSVRMACMDRAGDQITGNLNMSGGTITLDYRLNMASGTRSQTGSGTEEDPYVYYYGDGTNVATLTLTGGVLTTDAIDVANNNNWRTGINMASGYDEADGGTATINLDGGILSTVQVFSEAGRSSEQDEYGFAGISTFNFNGGTLRAHAFPDGWLSLMNGLTRANVRDGGAIIDTNGNDRYISQTLEHSDIDGDAEIDGGLTKNGLGSLSINGAFYYTGNTTVNAGTLSVQSASFADTSTINIASGAILSLNTGGATDVVDSFVVGGVTKPAGIYGAIGSGAQNEISQITGFGFIESLTGAASGYATWAAANVDSGLANEDGNNDGVDNGVAYFMNDAGVITLPGIDGTNKITWTNGGNIASGQYGTEFVVQTSPDLISWTDVDAEDPNLDNAAGHVSYTLPTGSGKLFVRLVVAPN